MYVGSKFHVAMITRKEVILYKEQFNIGIVYWWKLQISLRNDYQLLQTSSLILASIQ